MNTEIITKIKEISSSNTKKAITIIVDDQHEKGLCETLKVRYSDNKWNDIISYCEYDVTNKSEIYILVGGIDANIENIKDLEGIVIDLTDSTIEELVDHNMDLQTLRIQLLDGITLLKDTLIGIDFEDLKDVLKNCDNISASIVNQVITSDLKDVIEKLVKKARIYKAKCKSVYLYIDGDIGLMEANELARELESLLDNDINIAFTAAYDPSRTGEYYIMGLFAS